MIRKLANMISIVMHPLLMPTIVFFVIFNYAPTLAGGIKSQSGLMLLLAIFIITFILPALSIGILRFTNSIPDFHMRSKEERVVPFIFISIFYLIATFMFFPKLRLNEVIMMIMTGITAIVILVTIITFFWKISVHSAGISGAVGFIMALKVRFPHVDLLYPLLALIILAGTVMSARLYLDSHHPNEVVGGCALGFLISFSMIYVGL